MGQYYHVITEDKEGKREYFNLQNRKFLETKLKGEPDYEFYNGLKLMEHSWWENDFCRALALKLVDNPKRVCWVGDYAENDECIELGFTYDEVWNRADGDYTYVEETKFKVKDVKYLVNNDKKCYIDLKEYFEASNKQEEYEGKMYDWCIFPISILTCLGNGRGGGDYNEENPDVGAWKFDEIYLTNNLPEGYTKEDISFV